jgi:NAD-dependent SIR2 family protein deacetylase
MFISSLREKIQNDVKTTTITHKFIRTLRDGGRLVRNYTQNIDSLEQREGLCTEIARGPGNKARFHAKTQREPRPGVIDGESPHNGGAEVVLLHGNLVSLRCGICGKLCNWDSDDRQSTTLSGSAPDCPSCTEYNARRRGGGRRELAVGRLRPDVVLYGEEHPNANLIAPLITHDLSLGPDFLLIMGTSLRVHGLKVMVKEFAKAVHVKGGKVVFVNQTKPPESTWGEFIDYWVEWDCDEWVMDLQERRADIWLPQGSQMEMNRKESASDTKMEKTSKGSRTQVSRPQAVRDDKLNGVYQTFKILDSLRQIADSSGKISDRPIYWEKTGRTIIAPVKVEPSKQSRKSLPASRNTSKEANSKKRKSYPITLPNEKSIEEVAEVWDRLRKIAPGLGAAPPASGRIALEELHRNRGFPVQHMYTNITRSFPDQSANRFPWLDGLTLLTHPPSGAEPPIHAPKRIEKPAVMARPVNHAYGTRSSTRQSGISAESAMPAPLSEISNGNTTIVVVGTFSRPSLPLQISDANNTIVVDTPTCLSPSDMSNGSATIIVDNNPSQHSLPSSPSTEDEIVVAAPSTKVEKPPTPPTSDPMTPSAQRIKRMGSLGAILSSPEDGSRSSGSAGTVYYDAEEA